jgi:DNA-3-methyladenine glycosylase I
MFCYNCGVEIKRNHKFCFSCGIRLEFNNTGKNGRVRIVKNPNPTLERSSEKDIHVPDRLKTFDIKDIFKKMEMAIKKECSLSEVEFEKNWDKFKKYHYKNYSDNDIYWVLVQVAFYSGMKAATVTEKLPAIKKYFNDYSTAKNYSEIEVNAILKDPKTIHYKRKIEACINNAIRFDKLIKRHGSFSKYIESFGNIQEDRTIDLLKKDLLQFDYVGPITTFHVMLDLGLNVWKPDRVIRRILFRLGLISDKENIEQSILVGKEFSRQINEPIRYIDIIMVKYGQVGDEEGFGLTKGGICLEKNPRCHACGVTEYCTYPMENVLT